MSISAAVIAAVMRIVRPPTGRDDDGIHSFVVNIYSTHTLTRPRGLVPDFIWAIFKHLVSGNLVSGKSSLTALSKQIVTN